MKLMRSVLATTIIMLFALGSAGATNVTRIASGTSSVGVSFGRMTQAFAVLAHDADISIETYIGTTNVDSFVVEAGRSGFFYSPCDSIYVIRTTATAVTVNPTWNNAINPYLGGTNSVDLLSPVPVTITEHTLFTGLTMRSAAVGSSTNLASGYRTFPVTAGPDVHGAKALYLVIDYNDFQHGGFTIQHKFSASATDTAFNYYDGARWSCAADADTISISDSLGALAGAIPEDVAGSLVFRIPDYPGAGYYFVKLTPWGTAHGNNIYNMAGTLVVVQ